MPQKKNQTVLLIILLVILFIINYSYLDRVIEKALSTDEFANVTRVIDGDTIVIDGDTHVRLLGINCPETGEKYSKDAKEFLENEILNKKVRLEFGLDRFDKYKRLLAYVYLGSENVNLELIKKGLANFYFPSGKDKYYNNFKSAWEDCAKEKINLCEKSTDKCANCIKLKNFDYENEIVIFHNACGFDCDLTSWNIKDEGRKNFFFPDFILKSNNDITIKVREGNDTKKEFFWKGENYVWTETGDTLFLRDKDGGLVLWKNY